MALKSILAIFQSFIPGSRLIDGGQLQQLVNLQFSAKVAVTALAGGGQPGATPLTAALNSVDTCVTNNDSVALPLAIPGSQVTVYNNTAQTLAVYGQSYNPNTLVGDTIAAYNSLTQQPTATGVTQLTTVCNTFKCFTAGQWKQV